MTEVIIAIRAGLIISLLLEYLPGVADLWAKPGGRAKRLILAAVFLGLPVLAQVGACFGIDLHLKAVCDGGLTPQVILDALLLGGTALLASQIGYAGQEFAAQHGVNISLRLKDIFDKLFAEQPGLSAGVTVQPINPTDPPVG